MSPELESLYVKLRNREVTGAQLDLLNDDELFELAAFVNNVAIEAFKWGQRVAINTARAKVRESKKEGQQHGS